MCDGWVNAGVGAVVRSNLFVEMEVGLIGWLRDGNGRVRLEDGYRGIIAARL